MSAEEPDAPGDVADVEQESSANPYVDVATVHRKEGVGQQVTERVVTYETDAGEEVEERFEVVDGAHEYLGDGDASDRALAALEARF